MIEPYRLMLLYWLVRETLCEQIVFEQRDEWQPCRDPGEKLDKGSRGLLCTIFAASCESITISK